MTLNIIYQKIQDNGISDDEQQMYALREARMIYENALVNKYTLAQATNEVDATLAYY